MVNPCVLINPEAPGQPHISHSAPWDLYIFPTCTFWPTWNLSVTARPILFKRAFRPCTIHTEPTVYISILRPRTGTGLIRQTKPVTAAACSKWKETGSGIRPGAVTPGRPNVIAMKKSIIGQGFYLSFTIAVNRENIFWKPTNKVEKYRLNCYANSASPKGTVKLSCWECL